MSNMHCEPLRRAFGLLLLLGWHLTTSAALDADSLLRIWKNPHAADTTRFDAYHAYLRTTRAWERTSPDSAAEQFNQLRILAARANSPVREARAMAAVASMRFKAGAIEQSIELAEEAKAGFARLGAVRDEMLVLNAMGQYYMEKGDIASAIARLTDALRAAESLRDTSFIARVHGNIGILHYTLDDTAKAMVHYRARLGIAERIGQKDILCEVLNNMALVHMDGGRADLAVPELERALAVAKEIDYTYMQVNCLRNLGDIARDNGRPDEALARYNAALALTAQDDTPEQTSELLAARGTCFFKAGEMAKAQADGERAMALATAGGFALNIRDAAELLYKVYKAGSRTADALRMYERFVQMKDSVASEENKEELVHQRFQYEYDKKEALQRAQQEHERAAAEAERLAHKIQLRNILIGLVLVSCLALALLLLFKRSRNTAVLLAEKNATILEAQSKLVESERAREASELRTRIARDVHDQLGSDLTKLVMLSTEAKEVADIGTNGLSDIASDIERIAGEANRSLGDIVWAIDPHHDSLAGLTERVRAHCERMLRWSKVEHTVDCVHEGPDRSLDPATKRDIYLMLREALNNSIKYAHAKHISVRFHTSAAQVEFEVKDDGVGMDVDGSSGHGLGNMRARAERIGGSLDVRSIAGQGTRIGLRLTLFPV